MKTIFIILFMTFVFFPCYVSADSSVVGNTNKKIYCDDRAYLEIENETFKEDVLVSCEKISDDEDYAPTYQIDISKRGLPIQFTRKEIQFHLPISLLRDGINNIENLSLYFYDDHIKNWVIYSTDTVDSELIGKVIHTGKITVFEKQFQKNQNDIFNFLAWVFLAFGIIWALIYNKYMKKHLLILILFLTIFTGCSDNKDIVQYNDISHRHQEESITAFGYLSSSLNSYNEKKYDDAVLSADQCIVSYQKTKNYSQEGKDIALKANLASWIQEFKTISIQAEDLRIKQCESLKSVSSEAKKLNPDAETQAKIINEIAAFNDQFNKLQITLNDMQNQHANNFD